MWNDRRSQAVRFIRSRDPKERKKALEDYPELNKLIPVINLVKAGFGTYKDIFALSKTDLEEMLEVSQILTILNQEEELDNANRSNRIR